MGKAKAAVLRKGSHFELIYKCAVYVCIPYMLHTYYLWFRCADG